MSIRLSPDEAWEVLERSHTGILTTLRRDGSPITLPIWYVALDRTICFVAPSKTKKISRIRHDPRASFLVEAGERWAELRAVHLTGAITEVLDDAAKAEIDAALDAKYGAFKTARSEMSDATRDVYANQVFFRLVPASRILTWDNRRLELNAKT